MAEISVIIPSYNHAPFVREAIDSVIAQTLPATEIIVVDDGSTDDSVMRIREVADPRLKVIARPDNQGGAEALNIGIREARSPFIAICNSDDAWEPDKLARQLALLEAAPEVAAVFSDVSWVDARGRSVPTSMNGIFTVANRDRHAWIRHLVERQNCLCHPSVLAHRKVYDALGPYDNRLRQLPDYKMWLGLARNFELHVLPDRLVRFRLHANTSTPSPTTSTRSVNEYAFIIESFFETIDADTFHRAFGTQLDPTSSAFSLEVEKAIYLRSADCLVPRIFVALANRITMSLLATPEGIRAWRDYGFDMHEFHRLHGLDTPWIDLRAADPEASDDLFGVARATTPSHSAKRKSKLSTHRRVAREMRRLGRQLSSLVGRTGGVHR